MTWAFLGEALWRSTALLIGGTLLLRLSKRQSAAFRHRLLLGILALLAVLPVLSAILPAIPFPFWRPIVSETASVTVRQVSARTVARQRPYPPAWPNILWLLGFTVTLAPALTGTFSVFRIVRSARELDKRALHNALGAVKEERPAVPIFLSHAVSVPMTCGLLRPRIVLPASANGLDLCAASGSSVP